MRRSLAGGLALALLLSACATVTPGGVSTPSGPRIPVGALDLGGDWRRATPAAVLQSFAETVTSRYGAGLQLTAAAGDLRENGFTCAANNRTSQRGDPPAQICRKTQTVSDCTHTWQVHLFDDANGAILSRARGLYDRRCGGDGLLGGPG